MKSFPAPQPWRSSQLILGTSLQQVAQLVFCPVDIQTWASCGGVFSLSDRLCSAIFPCSPAPILAAGWLPLPPYFPEEMGLSFHFPFPLSVDFKEHGNTYDTRRGSAMCVSPWAGYVTSVSLTSLIHKFGWEFWGRII